ncbi:MAG TPA: hypothetical protein VHZ28_11365 [Terracidiphilus sp.]|jgi:Fe2+ transport system protein B|nr:hypothetical protein [Terracidiphilus sp.]
MATYVDKPEGQAQPSVKDQSSVKAQASEMVRDIQGEVKHEVADIQAAKEPVDPSHSDHVVRRHVAGLSISFFVMIVLFLLVVIGGIALYTLGHH